jgi:hypothetical protein
MALRSISPARRMITGHMLPVIRCRSCAQDAHGPACERYRKIAPCHCLQCWSRIDAEAALDAYRHSTDAAILRASLGNLIAYRDQVIHRRKMINEAEPLPPFPCGCGCGQMVTGAIPYGRPRRYIDRTHGKRAQRQAARLRAIQSRTATEDAMPQRWNDRTQFDDWWQGQIAN